MYSKKIDFISKFHPFKLFQEEISNMLKNYHELLQNRKPDIDYSNIRKKIVPVMNSPINQKDKDDLRNALVESYKAEETLNRLDFITFSSLYNITKNKETLTEVIEKFNKNERLLYSTPGLMKRGLFNESEEKVNYFYILEIKNAIDKANEDIKNEANKEIIENFNISLFLLLNKIFNHVSKDKENFLKYISTIGLIGKYMDKNISLFKTEKLLKLIENYNYVEIFEVIDEFDIKLEGYKEIVISSLYQKQSINIFNSQILTTLLNKTRMNKELNSQILSLMNQIIKQQNFEEINISTNNVVFTFFKFIPLFFTILNNKNLFSETIYNDVTKSVSIFFNKLTKCIDEKNYKSAFSALSKILQNNCSFILSKNDKIDNSFNKFIATFKTLNFSSIINFFSQNYIFNEENGNFNNILYDTISEIYINTEEEITFNKLCKIIFILSKLKNEKPILKLTLKRINFDLNNVLNKGLTNSNKVKLIEDLSEANIKFSSIIGKLLPDQDWKPKLTDKIKLLKSLYKLGLENDYLFSLDHEKLSTFEFTQLNIEEKLILCLYLLDKKNEHTEKALKSILSNFRSDYLFYEKNKDEIAFAIKCSGLEQYINNNSNVSLFIFNYQSDSYS